MKNFELTRKLKLINYRKEINYYMKFLVRNMFNTRILVIRPQCVNMIILLDTILSRKHLNIMDKKWEKKNK